MNSNSYKFMKRCKVCGEMWFTDTFKHTYSIVTFLFQYILPLGIVITSNLKICVALNKLPSIYTYRFRIQKNNLSEPSTHIIKFKRKSSLKRPTPAKVQQAPDDPDDPKEDNTEDPIKAG